MVFVRCLTTLCSKFAKNCLLAGSARTRWGSLQRSSIPKKVEGEGRGKGRWKGRREGKKVGGRGRGKRGDGKEVGGKGREREGYLPLNENPGCGPK